VRLFVALLGLISGMFVSVLLLLYVSWQRPEPLRDIATETEIFNSFTSQEIHGVSLGPAAQLNVAWLFGSGVGFSDDAIRNSTAAVVVLRDTAGKPVALATKLSAYAGDSNLLQRRVGMDSYWNIFWPNRGSIFLAGYEDRWPMLSDSLVSQLSGSGLYPQDSYVLSVDDRLRADSMVIGSNGLFENVHGQFRETVTTPRNSDELLQGSLQIQVSSD
jgi:hypothetical protein